MNKGIGGHTKPYRGGTDSWITPPEIIKALGPFDLDPCAALNQPWPCAKQSFNKTLDGLKQPWHGKIWLNPPYGPETVKWLDKMADHGNGIGLTFGRTDTKWFHDHIFNRADGILFMAGRLTFYSEDGKKAAHNSGGPSVLVAYGRDNCKVLNTCGISGHYAALSRKGELWLED